MILHSARDWLLSSLVLVNILLTTAAFLLQTLLLLLNQVVSESGESSKRDGVEAAADQEARDTPWERVKHGVGREDAAQGAAHSGRAGDAAADALNDLVDVVSKGLTWVAAEILAGDQVK